MCDIYDHPSFAFLYTLNFPEICFFKFTLQSVEPLNLLVERFEDYCFPTFHCFTQFPASKLPVQRTACFVGVYFPGGQNDYP